MALISDAAMVLFYDIEGRTADHDDWHSHEHFYERLSVPGFLRATRWVATEAEPRYMVIYEVSDVDVGTSQGYLERLNNPTEWTQAMMPRFRGMTRGFGRVVASHGFGLGHRAVALRFIPKAGDEDRICTWLAEDVLPNAASRRGIVGAHLLAPTAPLPMTAEQALRGPDKPMPWLVLISAYDVDILGQVVAESFAAEMRHRHGVGEELVRGEYALDHTATADEARAMPKPAGLGSTAAIPRR